MGNSYIWRGPLVYSVWDKNQTNWIVVQEINNLITCLDILLTCHANKYLYVKIVSLSYFIGHWCKRVKITRMIKDEIRDLFCIQQQIYLFSSLAAMDLSLPGFHISLIGSVTLNLWACFSFTRHYPSLIRNGSLDVANYIDSYLCTLPSRNMCLLSFHHCCWIRSALGNDTVPMRNHARSIYYICPEYL